MGWQEDEADRLAWLHSEADRRKQAAHGGNNHRTSDECAECRRIFEQTEADRG